MKNAELMQNNEFKNWVRNFDPEKFDPKNLLSTHDINWDYGCFNTIPPYIIQTIKNSIVEARNLILKAISEENGQKIDPIKFKESINIMMGIKAIQENTKQRITNEEWSHLSTDPL